MATAKPLLLALSPSVAKAEAVWSDKSFAKLGPSWLPSTDPVLVADREKSMETREPEIVMLSTPRAFHAGWPLVNVRQPPALPTLPADDVCPVSPCTRGRAVPSALLDLGCTGGTPGAQNRSTPMVSFLWRQTRPRPSRGRRASLATALYFA